ncbi:unnamed protein product [Rotaria socialis]|uniref:Uncharacterized protein n=1 Tax=Rotaria socialis TaxID=392032 RepID=A0A820WNQ3_9BILA|nr:unnamed protein product [Rotaria socialis]CAF4521288.1 unnamed protein product [Rotaria socialis]
MLSERPSDLSWTLTHSLTPFQLNLLKIFSGTFNLLVDVAPNTTTKKTAATVAATITVALIAKPIANLLKLDAFTRLKVPRYLFRQIPKESISIQIATNEFVED